MCFRCGLLLAARPLIGLLTNPGLWACAPGQPAAGSLIRVLSHPGFQVWAPSLLIVVCTHPGFQVWAPSLLIWVHTNRASGVCWGCFSGVHSPGAEGVGLQEATAAAQNSLNSCRVPLFSLFLFEKFLLFKSPGPNKHLSSHTAQYGSSPRILQQTLGPRLGASAAVVPELVPGTLLSLRTLLTV